jgi:positive regulator of sigma E activity
MQEPNKVSSETTLHKFLRYFSLVMTLIYPVLGLILYFSRPDQIAIADPKTKKIVGIILILYGIFRFYRNYKRSFGKKPEDSTYE